MNLFLMIFFGILVAPFVMALTFIMAKLALQGIVLMYVEAFSMMGWDEPRDYVRYELRW